MIAYKLADRYLCVKVCLCVGGLLSVTSRTRTFALTSAFFCLFAFLADGSQSNLTILVCPVHEGNNGVIDIPNKTDLFASCDVAIDLLGEPTLVQVPNTPPLTRKQFEAVSSVWPTNFHENKSLVFFVCLQCIIIILVIIIIIHLLSHSV